MKKILSLVLVALMIFSVVPAAFAADTAVVAEDAHQEALDFLSQVGVYHGGQAASDKLERWHMALFLARFTTGKGLTDDAYWATAENESGFADVQQYIDKGESYKAGAIAYAKQQGYIQGYGDGNFGPADGITLQDALVMVVRALGTDYDTYPWPFLNTAEQWGLTAGLEGVSRTEILTRAQIAQILYNAMFVEIEGETVAEKVFGVATDVVIITASNKVALNEANGLVTRTGFVQFAELDEQGVPAGTKYHVNAKVLGLADAAAQNAAVGTTYLVTHLDNYANIIGYKSLNETFVNNGDKAEIAFGDKNSTTGIYATITLGANEKAYVVDQYTVLNNLQGANKANDLREIKVYANGTDDTNYIVFGVVGSTYYIDAEGYVYQISTMEIVAYYSTFFGGQWYTVTEQANGRLTYAAVDATDATIEAIMDDLSFVDANDQYSLVNPTAVTAPVTAYAKAVASDIDNDGEFDRVMLREYSFGTYFQDGTYVTLTEGDSNVLINDNIKVTALRYTGVASSKFTKNQTYYVLFYYDAANAELDILEVIGQQGVVNAAADKDTYVQRGYVYGFHQTANLLYVNDGGTANGVNKILSYKLGYPTLKAAPITGFVTPATAADRAANSALAAELVALQSDYVEFVVVDNQIVYINNEADTNNDYVVIKEFVNIDETGIEVLAYNTVTDGLSQIKVTEIEGWNIKGEEWSKYYMNFWMQNIIGGGNLDFNDYISGLLPIHVDTLYRVVYHNGNEYNLTERVIPTAITDIAVAYNRVYDVTSTAEEIDKVTASDYWMFIEVDGQGAVADVFAISGPLANVTLAGVEVYKAEDNDYVVVGDATALAAVKTSTGLADEVTYMFFNDDLGLDTDYWQDGQGYYYGTYMTNVLTGEDEFVYLEAKTYAAALAFYGDLTDGAIYKVEDGILTADNAVDELEVADVIDVLDGAVAYTKVTEQSAGFAAAYQAIIDAVETDLGFTYAADEDIIAPENVTVKAFIGGYYYEFTVKEYTANTKFDGVKIQTTLAKTKAVVAHAVYTGEITDVEDVQITIILEPIA